MDVAEVLADKGLHAPLNSSDVIAVMQAADEIVAEYKVLHPVVSAAIVVAGLPSAACSPSRSPLSIDGVFINRFINRCVAPMRHGQQFGSTTSEIACNYF